MQAMRLRERILLIASNIIMFPILILVLLSLYLNWSHAVITTIQDVLTRKRLLQRPFIIVRHPVAVVRQLSLLIGEGLRFKHTVKTTAIRQRTTSSPLD